MSGFGSEALILCSTRALPVLTPNGHSKHSLNLPVALVTDRAKRGIIHLLHERPPTGGSHGKPYRATKILSHARRRGGNVAVCGACAAALDASDRVPQQRIA